jgi:hypothetical protein
LNQHVTYVSLLAARSATPRVCTYTGERASGSSCAGAIACRRAESTKGLAGGRASLRRLSLVRRAASTSLGVGTPPRRRALGFETRKRDRKVPRHEDGIPRANIRLRVRENRKWTRFFEHASEKATPKRVKEDRNVIGTKLALVDFSGTKSISRENVSRYCKSSKEVSLKVTAIAKNLSTRSREKNLLKVTRFFRRSPRFNGLIISVCGCVCVCVCVCVSQFDNKAEWEYRVNFDISKKTFKIFGSREKHFFTVLIFFLPIKAVRCSKDPR